MTTTDELFAPAPTRTVALVTFMLGMVPVPVRLFTPTNSTRPVDRKMYHKVEDGDGNVTYNKVNMPRIDSVTGDALEASEITYLTEYEGTLVELSDDEVAFATAGQAVDKGSLSIECLVPLDALEGRYKTYSWYQARPQKRQQGKKKVNDPVANKAFNLLLKALEAEQVGALVRFGLRSQARWAVLLPNGHLHFLYFDDETRQEADLPTETVSDEELTMARKILSGLDKDVPDLPNDGRDSIMKFLAEKVSGVEHDLEPVEVEKIEDQDFTALLAASVAATES